ncbi:MAG: phage tail protein [Paucimonas sp.]|nr:phage tail protein [Paucimonas sp.]
MARITFAGESLIAQKQGAKEVLQITRFIYANVPGLDANAPIDRAAAKPPANQIVHTYDIPPGNSGYVNPNQVVYSSMLGSDIGDFDWNWLGLESAEGVLFAVAYLPLQQKRRNIPPQQIGNNVTRNILVEYSGAQELTGITIDASTWQHDFTVRLKGIDERERLSNRDIYGRACFFGNGLRFEKIGAAYQLAAGVAYLEGIHLALAKAQVLAAPGGATQVWMRLTMRREQNDVVPDWKVVYEPDQRDYLTDDGWVYCIQLAELTASGEIIDLRAAKPIAGPLVEHFASRQSVVDLENGTTSAGKARRLTEARQIALQGDIAGHVDFDGSSNVVMQATLPDLGIAPGAYSKVVINAKGQVVGNQVLQQNDVPNLDWSKITSGKPTTLAGYGITDGIRRGQYGLGDVAWNITGESADNLMETGFYMGASIQGAPDAGWWFIENIRHNNLWCRQVWHSFNDSRLATRIQRNGGWDKEFMTHYHTGNLSPQAIVPPGMVIHYAAGAPPEGFLKANGAAISRATYARLFAVLGTYYGAGDGVSTFNLPDLRGEFIRGVDDGRGVDPGRVLGTWQPQDIQSHAHSMLSGSGSNWIGWGRVNLGLGQGAGTFATDAAGGAETRPRNIALLTCIKY